MSGKGRYNHSSRNPDYMMSQQKNEKLSPIELAILGRCSFTKAKEMEKTTSNNMKKTSVEGQGRFFSQDDMMETSEMFGRHKSPIRVVHQDFYNDFGNLFAEI